MSPHETSGCKECSAKVEKNMRFLMILKLKIYTYFKTAGINKLNIYIYILLGGK